VLKVLKFPWFYPEKFHLWAAPSLCPGSTTYASRACATGRSFKSWAGWLEGTVQPDVVLKIRHRQTTKIVTIYSGWWFGTFGFFSPIVGVMIQSDFHIFQGG
jgi:hypothetical protein